MNINEILRSGANVQLVINALDLKELFLEWQAEVEANKVKEKEETYKTVEEAAAILHRDRSSLWRWAKSGYLVPIKVGAKSFYRMSDIKKIDGGLRYGRKEKRRPKPPPNATTNVHNPNDLCKVLE